ALVTAAFKNPGDPSTADATADGPSWPVYVDPIGQRSYLAPYNSWVGGRVGLPRKNVNFVAASTPNALQWFTLLDDLNFGTDGKPASPVRRGGEYSWAYLLRRPQYSNAAFVDLTVVVYRQRSLALTGSFAAAETPYSGIVNMATSPNVVTLTKG